MNPFVETLAMRLRRAYLTMHRCAQANLEPLGITADQYVMMRLIQEEPGMNQQKLVELSASDASTVGAMARLLEKRGLVRRTADPGDRRSRRLQLTARGVKLLAAAAGPDQALHARVQEAVNAKELRSVEQALERIVESTKTGPRGDQPRGG